MGYTTSKIALVQVCFSHFTSGANMSLSTIEQIKLVSAFSMAIPVVEFSWKGYKIRKVFG